MRFKYVDGVIIKRGYGVKLLGGLDDVKCSGPVMSVGHTVMAYKGFIELVKCMVSPRPLGVPRNLEDIITLRAARFYGVSESEKFYRDEVLRHIICL